MKAQQIFETSKLSANWKSVVSASPVFNQVHIWYFNQVKRVWLEMRIFVVLLRNDLRFPDFLLPVDFRYHFLKGQADHINCNEQNIYCHIRSQKTPAIALSQRISTPAPFFRSGNDCHIWPYYHYPNTSLNMLWKNHISYLAALKWPKERCTVCNPLKFLDIPHIFLNALKFLWPSDTTYWLLGEVKPAPLSILRQHSSLAELLSSLVIGYMSNSQK